MAGQLATTTTCVPTVKEEAVATEVALGVQEVLDPVCPTSDTQSNGPS